MVSQINWWEGMAKSGLHQAQNAMQISTNLKSEHIYMYIKFKAHLHEKVKSPTYYRFFRFKQGFKAIIVCMYIPGYYVA